MQLELRGITKRFPGVIANDNVNLTLKTGEVLCLIGENGAGKSTLMNVLYGMYKADEGQIVLDGAPVVFMSPADAIAAGIGMVHQHFMLVPVFTVAENVVLGVEPTGRLGSLDIDKAREMVREVSDRYNLNLDPDAIIEDLPVGVQQRVEIVKVLLRDAKVVVFDEPTAVLTPKEIIEFFEIVKTLIAAGRGVVFITHKLKEALNVADRIAVLRRGQVVGEVDPKTATESQIAEMMVGRPVQLIVDKKPHAPGEVVLEVKDLSVLDADGRTMVDSVSFSVRAGEVVGIAGVQGNGQTELVDALTGLRNSTRGRVALDGQDITSASPRVRHAKGIAHIPEDRQRQGLVGGLSIAENLVLTRYHDEEFSNGIVMDWPVAHSVAENLIAEYDIRTPSADIEASTLSGGNQQKVIVARELSRPLRLSIAAQPTRGVDVGAQGAIWEVLREARTKGMAIVLISADLEELIGMSDRLLVMLRGVITAELDPQKTTPEQLGSAMTGAA
jgi:ABC-type uncharacterized transport system ATPase subunit